MEDKNIDYLGLVFVSVLMNIVVCYVWDGLDVYLVC